MPFTGFRKYTDLCYSLPALEAQDEASRNKRWDIYLEIDSVIQQDKILYHTAYEKIHKSHELLKLSNEMKDFRAELHEYCAKN